MALHARMSRDIKQEFTRFNNIAPCIIAGGAVRDTLNGRAIKDIDVYFNSKHLDRVLAAVDSVSARKYDDRALPSARAQQNIWSTPSPFNNISAASMKAPAQADVYTLGNLVDTVRDTESSEGTPVQLVFVNGDPVEYVCKYFDLGICKTWYDGKHIHCHNDYTNDINNRTITLAIGTEAFHEAYPNAQRALSHIRKHADRVKQKYPSYRVIVPTTV